MTSLHSVGSPFDGHQAGRRMPSFECSDQLVTHNIGPSTAYQEDRAAKTGQCHLDRIRGIVAVVTLPRIPPPLPGPVRHLSGVVDHTTTQRAGTTARVVRNRSFEGLFEAGEPALCR